MNLSSASAIAVVVQAVVRPFIRLIERLAHRTVPKRKTIAHLEQSQIQSAPYSENFTVKRSAQVLHRFINQQGRPTLKIGSM